MTADNKPITKPTLTCKLTTPAFQQRKQTILAGLKKRVTAKKELEDGFAFAFPATDQVLDELVEFIKTERTCCDFFNFNLWVSGHENEAWLTITGATGAKDFISTVLGL